MTAGNPDIYGYKKARYPANNEAGHLKQRPETSHTIHLGKTNLHFMQQFNKTKKFDLVKR